MIYEDEPTDLNADKCTYKSSCWPSDTDWQAFNATIDGMLIMPRPLQATCFDKRLSAECLETFTKYTDAYFIDDIPGASMTPLWDCGLDAKCCW